MVVSETIRATLEHLFKRNHRYVEAKAFLLY
jgi:hypothetical protein